MTIEQIKTLINGLKLNIPHLEWSPELGISSAAVGQTVRVAAVDDNGMPTAWEAVDAEIPRVEAVSGSEVSLTMEHNAEYRCADAVTTLTITDFTPAADGRPSAWSVQFTAGEGVAVTVPESVKWSGGAPAFTAGITYRLSFTPFITGEVVGTWLSNE